MSAMVARWTLGAIWIYQGLVPKVLFPETGERAIIAAMGQFPGHEGTAVMIAGVAEIVLGVLTIIPATSRLALWAAVAGLPLLLISGIIGASAWLVTPFNMPTLVASMFALAVIGLVHRSTTQG